MKSITRKAFLLILWILLTTSTALALDSGSGSDGKGPASKLGPLSDIAGDFQTLFFWLAIFVAIISLVAIWVTGNAARAANKVTEALTARKNIEGWVIDAFLVLIGFIVFFGYIVPKLSDLMGVA